MFEVTFPDAIGGGYTILMEPSQFYPLLNVANHRTVTLDTGETIAYDKRGKRLIYRFMFG